MQPTNPLATPEELFDGADPPLILKLRCKGCQKRFSRSFAWACISPEHAADDVDWDGILLSDIVQCPRCKAVDDYEVTPMSMLQLTLPAAFRNPEADWGGQVINGVPQLWDGSIVRRPSRALERLRELTRENPESAKAFRHLGNACERWHRHDEALSAWRAACELDEAEVEAAYSIARVLLDPARRPADGFSYLRRALHAFPEAVHAGDVKPDLGRAIIELLGEVVQSTRDSIALIAMWDTVSRGQDPGLTLSSVDLKKLESFDRLADLVSAGHFIGLDLTPELPDEEPTLLQELLSVRHSRVAGPGFYDIPVPPPRREPTKAPSPVGRNDPCPCASGKKYKRCCGGSAAK